MLHGVADFDGFFGTGGKEKCVQIEQVKKWDIKLWIGFT
jgi:hypothetical protein